MLCAAAFDAPALYVPGIAFALLIGGSWLWVGLAARPCRLERTRGPWSIVEGDRYGFDVRVRAWRLPLPGATVVHPLAEHPSPVRMRPGRRARLELRSPRRGRRRVEPATLLLGDPVGLCTAEVRSEHADELLVLPRIEPVVSCEGRGGTRQGVIDGSEGPGGAGLDTRPIDFEPDGLRPYRHGSPASRIHWPTVARTGEVVEHRLVAGADISPLVALDSSDPAGEEALDRAVRAAASLCVHLARAKGCALLLCGERRPLAIDPHLRAWPQVHARLAVVGAGGAPPAITPTGHSEVIFWVTGGAEAAPTAARRLHGRAGYLVTPFPVPGLESRFVVAGCHGHRMGSARKARTTLESRVA
jgi:uncharacterized protein (DUF58 family)